MAKVSYLVPERIGCVKVIYSIGLQQLDTELKIADSMHQVLLGLIDITFLPAPLGLQWNYGCECRQTEQCECVSECGAREMYAKAYG